MNEHVVYYHLSTREQEHAPDIVSNALNVYRANNAKIFDKTHILPQYFIGKDDLPSFSLYPYCGAKNIFILTPLKQNKEDVVDSSLLFVVPETTKDVDPFADIPTTLTLYLSKSGELMVKGKKSGDVSIGFYRNLRKAFTS